MHNIYNLHNILFYLICFYLLQLQDAMSANITPVQRDGRQAQRGVRCIMVFVQKTCNLVWKHRQNSILAKLTSISMQYCLPSKHMVPTVVSSSTNLNQFVCWESSSLCAIPNVDVNACKLSTGYYLGRMWFSIVPAIRPERDTFAWPWINNLPIVNFASIFKSHCNQCNVS